MRELNERLLEEKVSSLLRYDWLSELIDRFNGDHSTEAFLPIYDTHQNVQWGIYLVGGMVRDLLLGKTKSKDIDLMVAGHQWNYDHIVEILKDYGRCDIVGKSFGVLKFSPNGSDQEIDIGLARLEKNTGDGHRDLTVDTHLVTADQDLKRRDFTINAISVDLTRTKILDTLQINDPYNGMEDLQKGIISCVDAMAFIDDPLRMLRGLQFKYRLKFEFDRVTEVLIKGCADMMTEVSGERIRTEFEKVYANTDTTDGVIDSFIDDLNRLGLYEQIFGFKYYYKDSFNRGSFYRGTVIETEEQFWAMILQGTTSDWKEIWLDRLKGDRDMGRKLAGLQHMYYHHNLDYLDGLLERSDKGQAINYARGVCRMACDKAKTVVSSGKFHHSMYNDILKEFESGKRVHRINQLAVNGNDMKELGFEGSNIGDVLDYLVDQCCIYDRKNDKQSLINSAKHYLKITTKMFG